MAEGGSTGLYVIISVYLLLMFGVTIIANRRNAEAAESAGDAGAISTHFLGGKGFGPVVLTMTMLASIFSGYTVVGVPNEASKDGFQAVRWIGGIIFIAISMSIINPRMRRLSIVRNYESPGDFLMDRFDSVKIKWLGTCAMCLPQIIYLAVQFHSLSSLLETLSGKELNFYAMVPVCCGILLLFEHLGGMRSVAYTDAIQSIFMVLLFLVTPITLTFLYGGFIGQVGDPKVDRGDGLGVCSASQPGASGRQGFGCLNYDDLNGTAPAAFLRTPSTMTNISNLLFYFSFFSFAINPHIITRVLSAKEDKDIKFVSRLTWASGFFAQLTGIIIGVTVLSQVRTFDAENQGADVKGFYKLLRQWQGSDNVFLNTIAYSMVLAALAGIMSTADSALIAVSNTVSVDLYRGWYNRDATGEQTLHFGKWVSLTTAVLAGGVACYLQYDAKGGAVSYGSLITLQSGILWQGFPAFMLGLWTKISSHAIVVGGFTGIAFTLGLILYELVAKGNKADDIYSAWTIVSPEHGDKLHSSANAILGALVNLAVSLITWKCCSRNTLYNGLNAATMAKSEMLLGGTDKFGNLNLDVIEETMEGLVEPLTHRKGMWIWLSLGCMLCTFLAKIDSVGEDLKGPARNYMFNGEINSIILGLPRWTFWDITLMVCGAVCGIIGTGFWSVEDMAIAPADGYIEMEATTQYDPPEELNEGRNRNSWTGEGSVSL